VATVQIDDALLNDLVDDARRCGLPDDPGKCVSDLIRFALSKAAEGRYGRCGLTGCKTRWSFTMDLNRDTWGSSRTGDSLYEESFLCLDIDHFQHFVDHEGFGPSDEVLTSIGRQLLDHFGEADTYRYGGDEFVVRLRGRQPWIPTVPDAITLKWAVAEIRVHRNRRRNHHLNGWIDHHIRGAILAATPQGRRVQVRTPDWMTED